MATHRICSVEGCGKKHFGHGWCNAHYVRWRKYGNLTARQDGGTEYGEAACYFRDVVLAYDGNECLIWPYHRNRGGYARLNGEFATRLICAKEYGPAPTPEHQAAHSCGKGHLGCVTKRHLSWKTVLDNHADKAIHGTLPRGEHQGGHKLTETKVREIRALKGVAPQRDIAKRFGVSQASVCLIQKGQTWGWL